MRQLTLTNEQFDVLYDILLDAIDEIPEDVLYQTEHWKTYEQLKGVKS